jgi:hypothetical protein
VHRQPIYPSVCPSVNIDLFPTNQIFPFLNFMKNCWLHMKIVLSFSSSIDTHLQAAIQMGFISYPSQTPAILPCMLSKIVG